MDNEMAAPGALEGIRILDLAAARGVFCGRLFADLGADVIKVEPPRGDALRRREPFGAGGRPDIEASLPYFINNLNKRGITLNLECDDGRLLLKRLVAGADAIIETAEPGWMHEHGIGYADCAEGRPDLVWAAITPFGQWGPNAHLKATEMSGQATGGPMFLTGEPGGRPVRSDGYVADKMGSYVAAAAMMFALYWRGTSGRGQFIDVSVQEAVASQMESHSSTYRYTGRIIRRDGRLYSRTYPTAIYPCEDGWVTIVAGVFHQWDALRQWVGDPRLMDEKFLVVEQRMVDRPYLDAILCEWTKKHRKADLMEEGQRRRIPVGVCLTPSDVTRNPHLRERGYFARVKHARLGDVEVPGAPFNMDRTPWRARRPAPLLGEHNAEVYRELGLMGRDLVELQQAGVI